MGRNKLRRKRKKLEKTILMIIAILVSVLLWVYVITQVNPVTKQSVLNVPVKLINTEHLENRGLAVRGLSEHTINITVEGKRADLIDLDKEEIKAEADLFGFEEGENYIPVNIELPKGIEIADIKTVKMPVIIEKFYEKKLPVKVVLPEPEEEETEIVVLSLKPKEVIVSGAKSEVAAVSSVQVIPDKNKITADGANQQIVTIPVDKDGVKILNIKLSSEVADVEIASFKTKEVALNVETTGDFKEKSNLKLNYPKSIRIMGKKEDIKDIEQIKTEILNMEDLSLGDTFSLKLVLPENVYISGDKKTIQGKVVEVKAVE